MKAIKGRTYLRLRTVLPMAVLLFCIPEFLVAQNDTTPPALTQITGVPSVVDVTTFSQIVTFYLHVTDNFSGVDTQSGNRISLTLKSPAGDESVTGLAVPQGGILTDTIVAVPVAIPQFSEAGIWSVSAIRLSDLAGNTLSLTGSQLSSLGLSTGVTVLDSTPDLAPPQLVSLKLTPAAVNVSSQSAVLTLQVTATDDASGLSTNSASQLDFVLTSPSGQQSRYISLPQFQLISGTTTNGIWQAALNMPQYSEPGVWTVTSVRLVDFSNRQHLYLAADLASLGPALNVTVTSSPTDAVPPVATQLTFTPAVIDTSVGNQTVLASIGATDALSGVSFAPDTPTVSQFVGLQLVSPSGAQTVFTNSAFSNATPISGGAQNGLWQFGVSLPQFSEAGTWHASLILKDATRNLVTYTPAQLAALGLSSQLIVMKPSLQQDGVIGPAGGTVTDSVFGGRAKLTIPAGVLAQQTSVAIDVLQSPLGVAAPPGFSSAESYFVNFQLTPQPVYPLASPLVSITVPLRTYITPGATINLYSVDPVSGSLLPFLDSTGTILSGRVMADGLEATFVGVTHFSTIAALLPDPIAVRIDVRTGQEPPVINSNFKGKLQVILFGTATLDATKIAPDSLTLSGAPVAKIGNGRWLTSTADIDGDGWPDLIANFEGGQIPLSPGSLQLQLTGISGDGRRITGSQLISVK